MVELDSQTKEALTHGVVMSAVWGGLTYATFLQLSKALSQRFSKAYRRLSEVDKLDWDIRLPSTVHALVLSFVAAYLFLLTDVFSDSQGQVTGGVIYSTHLLSHMALGFSVGYFIVDLGIMLSHSCLGGPELVAHHFAALAAVAAAAFRFHAHNYTLALLATECTTPFVNMRWLLDKGDMRQSQAYVVNGVALMLMWLVGRIVLFYFFFTHAYAHMHEIAQLPPTSLALVAGVPPLLFALNVFWFGKIVQGALKLFLGSPKAKQKAGQADGVTPAVSAPPVSKKEE